MISYSDVEIAIENGRIEEIGSSVGDCDELLDCNQRIVTPGFVDSHTHPVFLDGRHNEFFMRLSGVTYNEISNSGGGILNSINGVRNSPESSLFSLVKARMDSFLYFGTTTVECKSGYGLDIDSELKSLKILEEVNQSHNIDII